MKIGLNNFLNCNPTLKNLFSLLFTAFDVIEYDVSACILVY